MKKHLLLFLAVVLSISAFAADLNPFAYKLGTPVYDAKNNSVTIGYHLNAPANMVRIVIYQDEAHPVAQQDFTGTAYTSAGAHSAVVSLHGVPGGNYTYKIEVYGKGQSSTTAFHKRTILNSPMSVDIDNNMNSPYFGRTLVTQPTKNDLRGIYEYWPAYFTQDTAGTRHYGNVNWYDQSADSWYYDAHATPLRVRVAQDGTGRVFTTACDVDKNTYLWYVDPANLDNWSSVLTASEMKEIVNHPSNLYVHNISLDIRVTNDNKLDLLLLSGSVEKGTEFVTGYIYSGIYTLPADFPTTTPASKKSAYTSIVNPNYPEGGMIEPHEVIKSALLPLVVNSSSQFDKYGGVWFCGTTEATTEDPNGGGKLKDKSALVHVKFDPKKEIKDNYLGQDLKLTRYYTNSGGFRYNRDFSQVLVGYGELYQTNGSYKTARLYKVTQQSASAHPSLEYVADLGVINNASETNHVVDFAWDHANNIYVILRNGNASVCGIYTYATKYDSNTPFVTKAPNGVTFEVKCYDNVTYTLMTSVNDANMGTISAGGQHKSCTSVDITATPKEGYYLKNWTIDGIDVDRDGDNTYTLYMTDDISIRANFAPAKYNVTWWNLFQNGEDIAKDNPNYPKTNERLWRLLQVVYNADENIGNGSECPDHTNDNTGRYTVVNKKQLNVSGFLGARNGTRNFFRNNSLFKWLGDYLIAHSKNGLENTIKESPWTYYPYMFINRTDSAINWANNSGEACNYAFNGTDCTGTNTHSIAWDSFIKYGHPDYWRPYWTEKVCDLPQTYNYNQDMPVTWDQSTSCPSGTIANVTPSNWYQWNKGGANQLLVWRESSTSGRIVHHVDKPDMKLYATYVDKHISDSKDNTDVIRLMQNPRYNGKPHTVTVDRKLQAGMYNTICLPFSVDRSILPNGHPLKLADVRKLTGKTEELYDTSGESVIVLNFEPVTQMEAGKPYIIKLNGSDNVTDPMTFTNVVYNDLTIDGVNEEVTENFSTVTFHAIMKPTEVPEGALILVADNRLAIATGGEMKGLRGYFVIDDPYLQEAAEDGRVYMSMNKPTTTSIPVAPEAEQQTKPKVRKIMRDGHIYILRGEEIYTITGHRVK